MKHVLTAVCSILISTIVTIIISLQFKPNHPEITINEDGFWVIDGAVTDVSALGIKGANGEMGAAGEKGESPTVEIDDDGYWVINGITTNVKATPEAPETSALGLDFYLKDDGSYAVAIGKAKYLSEIEIPSEYNNRPVTSIAAHGFSETEIQSIRIPDSITAISSEAFSKCNYLERVYIENLASWCQIDFQGDDGTSNPLHCAKELYVNNTLTETVIIPEGTKKISPHAFMCFSGLKKVVIPNSTTEIGACAFYECTKLSSVTVGNGLSEIADTAFKNCKSILEIYDFSPKLHFTKGAESEGYIAYSALDIYESESEPSKLFYDGDYIFRISEGENLLASYLGNLTDITLPEKCKNENYKISDKLFYGNTALKRITIPSGVLSIGASCFHGCNSIEYVIIGNGIKHIGNSAFPENLSSFYYIGTEADWSKVEIENANVNVKFLTKYYSESAPSESTNRYWHFLNGEPTLWN